MIRNTEAVDARTAEAEEKLEEADAQMAEAQALQDAVQSELDEYQALLQDATICYIQIIGEESGRSIQLCPLLAGAAEGETDPQKGRMGHCPFAFCDGFMHLVSSDGPDGEAAGAHT